MYYISHRGNLDGKNINQENSISAINKCLSLNIDVEIDIWSINRQFYIGHDKPQAIISEAFIENPKIWCHAKNEEALFRMLHNKKIHCFWQDIDDYSVTSNGFIWVYPGKKLNSLSIAVLPEIAGYSEDDLSLCLGICSDNILGYLNAKNNK
jgi:hypothetical protein